MFELLTELERTQDDTLVVVSTGDTYQDAEFGGYDERKRLEKSLVRRLDIRMSILVLIYILNYVSALSKSAKC